MWAVGNGQKISIREDKWLKKGKIGGIARQNEPNKVADLIDFQTATWKEDLLRSMFDDSIVTEIKAIPIGLPNTEDKLVWTNNNSGTYTVKSGYFLTKKPTTHQETLPTTSHQIDPHIWKLIWNSVVQPKIKFFLWSACNNALPTSDDLYRRKIVPAPTCPLCNLEAETVEHTLLLCPWTAYIWNEPTAILNWLPQLYGIYGRIATISSSTNTPLTLTKPCPELRRHGKASHRGIKNRSMGSKAKIYLTLTSGAPRPQVFSQ